MFRLISSIIFLIILAVLIVLNLGYNTSFNLYWWKLNNIPVMVIAILSFVLGIIYSFFYYLINYFDKKSKDKIKKKGKLFKTKEQEFKEKEKKLKEKELPSTKAVQEQQTAAIDKEKEG